MADEDPQHSYLTYAPPPRQALIRLDWFVAMAFPTVMIIVAAFWAPRSEAMFRDFRLSLSDMTIFTLAVLRWVRNGRIWMRMCLGSLLLPFMLTQIDQFMPPALKPGVTKRLGRTLLVAAPSVIVFLWIVLGLVAPTVQLINAVAGPKR